ncbi:MAG: methyltransferase family protein, partial [Desulfomonilaceae bacterium]
MGTENQWTRESLLELSRAFMLSRIFLSAAELGLFDVLAAQALSLEDVCAQMHCKPRGVQILLDALAANGLARKDEKGRYSISEDMAKLLTTSSDESVLPMVLHGVSLWKSWSNLTEVVRQGENVFRIPIDDRPDHEIESFIGAMHVIGKKMAQRVAESIDLTRFKRLLDVGGASGTYVMAFLKAAPNLTATIFDLPRVTNIARARIE